MSRRAFYFQADVTTDTLDKTVTDLERLTTNPNILTSTDLIYVSNVLNKIVRTRGISTRVRTSVHSEFPEVNNETWHFTTDTIVSEQNTAVEPAGGARREQRVVGRARRDRGGSAYRPRADQVRLVVPPPTSAQTNSFAHGTQNWTLTRFVH